MMPKNYIWYIRASLGAHVLTAEPDVNIGLPADAGRTTIPTSLITMIGLRKSKQIRQRLISDKYSNANIQYTHTTSYT
jgi:hypothetical protein